MRAIDSSTNKDRELTVDNATGGLLAKLVGAITATVTGGATEAKQDTGNTSVAAVAAAQPYLKPPGSHTAITPSDSTDVTAITSIGLLCTVAGSLSIRGATTTGTTVTFPVVAGQYVYGAFSRVMAATTATTVGLAP